MWILVTSLSTPIQPITILKGMSFCQKSGNQGGLFFLKFLLNHSIILTFQSRKCHSVAPVNFNSVLFRPSANSALNLSCHIQLIRNQDNYIHKFTTHEYVRMRILSVVQTGDNSELVQLFRRDNKFSSMYFSLCCE